MSSFYGSVLPASPLDPIAARILRDYVSALDLRIRAALPDPRPWSRFFDGHQVCAPVLCWSCHEEILVFADYPRNDNICPYCGRLQGNFYLYMEPDGPFFGLHPPDLEDPVFGFQAVASYLLYCRATPFDVPHGELDV